MNFNIFISDLEKIIYQVIFSLRTNLEKVREKQHLLKRKGLIQIYLKKKLINFLSLNNLNI